MTLASEAFARLKAKQEKKPGFKRNVRLRKKSKGEAAELKEEIQATMRQIAIIRDGGCVLRDSYGEVWEGVTVPACNGFRKDGELILQYEHLNSRAHNISYADMRLGVCICVGHHGWKKWNKKAYDSVVKKIIGVERTKLWERVENDRRPYPMGSYEWGKVLIALKYDLKQLQESLK